MHASVKMLLRLQNSEYHVQMDLQQHEQLQTSMESLCLETQTSSSKVLAEPVQAPLVSLCINNARKHLHAVMQGTDLVCSTDPELEEGLSLCVEGATICEGSQQDVGRPELVHPVIPVLVQNRGVLQSMSQRLRREDSIAEPAIPRIVMQAQRYLKMPHHMPCPC